MKHHEPMEDWEAQLHRDLTQLPELNAPATLIPGVLSRLSAAAPAAWYQRAWWQWPIGLRIASGVCVIALLGALGWSDYDGRAEVITPYFGASGTGQINAVFPVTAVSGHAIPPATASTATGYQAATRL